MCPSNDKSEKKNALCITSKRFFMKSQLCDTKLRYFYYKLSEICELFTIRKNLEILLGS